MPVHKRSIGRLEISNCDAFARAPHFGVSTRHVAVINHHVNFGASTDDESTITDDE
jgi:hypothetical protein